MGLSVFPAPASGPTLAEITTAITTNAAPASVTNSSIATQVANNAPSPNAWTLLGSATVTYNSASVSFSGIGGYKTYRLVVPYVQLSGGGGFWHFRINNDTSSVYDNWFIASGTGGASQDSIRSSANGTNFVGVYEVSNANTSGAKVVKLDLVTFSNNSFGQGTGIYRGTSAVSTITFSAANVIGNGNTIYLYGAN